jgi:hypothetical protein
LIALVEAERTYGAIWHIIAEADERVSWAVPLLSTHWMHVRIALSAGPINWSYCRCHLDVTEHYSPIKANTNANADFCSNYLNWRNRNKINLITDFMPGLGARKAAALLCAAHVLAGSRGEFVGLAVRISGSKESQKVRGIAELCFFI